MEQTAKVFMSGNSQAVRLPKEYRFAGDEVGIRKLGDLVVLYEPEKEWELFSDSFVGVSDDFLVDRDYGKDSPREMLR